MVPRAARWARNARRPSPAPQPLVLATLGLHPTVNRTMKPLTPAAVPLPRVSSSQVSRGSGSLRLPLHQRQGRVPHPGLGVRESGSAKAQLCPNVPHSCGRPQVPAPPPWPRAVHASPGVLLLLLLASRRGCGQRRRLGNLWNWGSGCAQRRAAAPTHLASARVTVYSNHSTLGMRLVSRIRKNSETGLEGRGQPGPKSAPAPERPLAARASAAPTPGSGAHPPGAPVR